MKNLLAIIILPIFLLSTNNSFAEVTNFHSPTYKGQILNVCYTWGQNCGSKPANEWCKYNGYEKAYTWSTIDRKQLNKPTRVMGSNAVCDAGACSGFSSITCAKTQTYSLPKYRGVHLNVCYTWGQNCGAKPANEWCKTQGYKQAVNWAKIDRKQLNKPTRVMGSNAVCDAGACSGFSSITCR